MNSHITKLTLPLLIALSLSACGNDASKTELNSVPKQEKPRPVKLISLSNSVSKSTYLFPATISANQEVEVSFQIAGRLTQFDVKPGDMIQKGDLLASIDAKDYRNQLTMNEAEFDLAKAQFDRISNLYSKQLISKAEFDSAAAQLKAAQAALKLTQNQVGDTQIYAPFSGQIATTMVENFQFVQPQQTLLLLQDTNKLNVVIQLPAIILNQLSADSTDAEFHPQLIVKSGNQSHTFPVEYKQHATHASPGTQSYEVVFTLDNPQGMTLYSGMGASVSIDFSEAFARNQQQEFFFVPLSAVKVDDASGDHQIWVYNEESQRIFPTPVHTGEVIGESVLVTGDLSKNSVIATAGITSLKPGMHVRPLLKERGL